MFSVDTVKEILFVWNLVVFILFNVPSSERRKDSKVLERYCVAI